MHDRLATLMCRPAGREPVIDGVRAIAVLWVVAFHVLFFQLGSFPDEVARLGRDVSTRWILQGTLGVDLFFVISGYLIGSILMRELAASKTIALRRFYARRILRLMPVYVVVMVLSAWFLREIPRSMFGMAVAPSGNVENAWANLLYVNNWVPIHEQYMGWCWSLAIEEQFYLIAPLLLLLVSRSRRPMAWMLALLVLSGLVRLAILQAHDLGPPRASELGTPQGARRFDLVYDKLHVRYGGLLVGVVAAHACVFRGAATTRWFASSRRSTLVMLAGAIVVGAIASLSIFTDDAERVPPIVGQLVYSHHRDLFAVAAMSMILAAMHGQGAVAGGLRRVLSLRGLYPLAQLSYSVYLVHEVVMIWGFPRSTPWLTEGLGLGASSAIVINGALALAATLVIAVLLFLLVELPSMKSRRSPAFQRLVSGNRSDPAGE